MFFSINFLPLHFVCVCVYNNIYFEIQSTIYFEDVKSLDQTIAQKKADLSTPVICDAYDAFELWCWRRLLRVPWTARKSNQSILKEISPGCSLEGLMLKVETPILWPPHVKSWPIGKDSDAGRDWGQEEKGTTEDEMAGCITDSMGMSLSELRELVMDREAWRAVIHGVKKSWTRLSDWTELIYISDSVTRTSCLPFEQISKDLLLSIWNVRMLFQNPGN